MLDVKTKMRNSYKVTIITGDEFCIVTKETAKYSAISDAAIASAFARFFAKVNGNTYVFNSLTSLGSFSTESFAKENSIRANLHEYSDMVYFHPTRCNVKDDAVFPIRNFFDIKAKSVGNDNALVSGGFFLLQTNEVDSQYSWFGDPFGLLISNYKTYSYATFERSCIVQDENGDCFISRLSCSDFDYGHNDVWFTPIIIYSRATIDSNPFQICEKGFVDFLLLNGRVHDMADSGKIECPVSGIIVRFAYSDVPDWTIGTSVDVRFTKDKKKIRFAIQCAPKLVENDRVVLTKSSFYNDYLVTPHNDECLVPRVYDRGYIDGCNRIKVGMGFTKSNKLIWIALEPNASEQITLFDVANELLEHEAKAAIALDGGGSVKAYHASDEIVGAKEKKRSLPYFIEIS